MVSLYSNIHPMSPLLWSIYRHVEAVMPSYTLLWPIQSLARAQEYICSARAFKSSFLALPLKVYSKRLIFHWKLSCTIAALSLTQYLVCNAQRALPLKYTIPFRMSCQEKKEELVENLCPMVIWGAWDYRATPSVSEALWMLSQVVWRSLQHSYLYLCTLALKHSMPNRTIRTRPISVKNSSTIGRSDFAAWIFSIAAGTPWTELVQPHSKQKYDTLRPQKEIFISPQSERSERRGRSIFLPIVSEWVSNWLLWQVSKG